MSEPNWQLKIAFVDESPSFAHGWEAGKVHGQMLAGVDPIEATVHAVNREVLTRAAVAEGYEVAFEDAAEGWLNATFTRAAKAPLGNPYGLRVVR